MVLNLATVAIVAAFVLRAPFDERHQRRLFVLGSDNVSSLRDIRQVFQADGLDVWVDHLS